MPQPEWGCVMPFWIDTDGYTDRDREMFVCGVEFQMLYADVQSGWRGSRPIHRDNESRVRMMCGKLGLKCEALPIEGYEDYATEISGLDFRQRQRHGLRRLRGSH